MPKFLYSDIAGLPPLNNGSTALTMQQKHSALLCRTSFSVDFCRVLILNPSCSKVWLEHVVYSYFITLEFSSFCSSSLCVLTLLPILTAI